MDRKQSTRRRGRSSRSTTGQRTQVDCVDADAHLRSPLALWGKLQSDAGLELRLPKGGVGRDADFEMAVLDALGSTLNIKVGPSVNSTLKAHGSGSSPQITVEDLLIAVLTAQKPFADMMRQILRLLVLAGAQSADHTLLIEFRFDQVSDPIRVTLEQFRQWVEQSERALRSELQVPEARELWRILGALRSVLHQESLRSAPDQEEVSVHETKACELLSLLEVLVKAFQAEAENYRAQCIHKAADSRASEVQGALDASQSAERARLHDLYDAWKDNWHGLMREQMNLAAAALRNGALSCISFAKTVEPLLQGLPRRDIWVDTTVRELLDLLDLPAWKKRNELYSVWVGVVLLECIHRFGEQLHFNIVNGVLSFAFGGSQLAAYQRAGVAYEVWAELRSALTRVSTVRSEGIQPDFRVLKSGTGDANARTTFVVEVKHYLKANLANFAEALKDYAHSCPTARISLVNHGWLDAPALMQKVDPDLRSQVILMSEATVKERAALFDMFHAQLFPGLRGGFALQPDLHNEVRVEWAEPLQDIDLHLVIYDLQRNQKTVVNYLSKGDRNKWPFAFLYDDVRGPGEEPSVMEAIAIEKWLPDHRYEVIVKDFSETRAMKPGALACEVRVGTQCERIEFPTSLSENLVWPVVVLEVRNDVVRLAPDCDS